jgi:Ca2+-binding RTX toxin-like protein
VLTVIDSGGNDTVTITTPAPGQVQVESSFFPTQLFDSADVSSIVVSFGDGDDGLLVSADITTTLLASGGAGDDVLVGGGGSNVLLGGAGIDALSGRGARDILIGGADNDLLYGSGGQDILIDGATSHDGNAEALLAILVEWNTGDDSLASFQLRRNHLRGTVPGGLNGPYFLDVTTLLDDAAMDFLLSGAGTDWILRHNGDLGI